MTKHKKERGFMDKLKNGISNASKIIATTIFPSIAEGADMVMKRVEDRIMVIERRILRKLLSFLVIGFGAVFLILALFFYMRESLGWSKAAVFFCLGMIVLVIGLVLKAGESDM